MDLRDAVKIRIEDLCMKNGISLNQAIKRAGVNQSTLSEFMVGRSKLPDVKTIKKLAEGFGMSLSEFFGADVFDQVDEQ